MSEKDKFMNVDMLFDCEKLDFRMYSLRDFLCFRQGRIHFDLPNGIEYPKDCKKNIEKRGFSRVFSKLKKNNRK